MGYDVDLARRVRDLLAGESGLSEKRMFGGLAFLVGGNLAVAVSHAGGLMVRVDPAEATALADEPGVAPVEMRGRTMRGWLRVRGETLAGDDALATWVGRGIAFARSLPAKA